MTEGADARVHYGDHEDQFVDLWIPSGLPIGTAVLFHGGYWRDRYSLELMDPMAEHLREAGWAAVNVEYRRVAEEHDGTGMWPEMADDVSAAVELSGAEPVVLIGHSAGGQLALWAAHRHRWVRGVLALAPVADLQLADELGLSDHAVRGLLGGSTDAVAARYDDASPAALLPIGVDQVIVHGDADESVPQRLSVTYASAATAAGDRVRLIAESGVDHMQIIDPTDRTWRLLDEILAEWANGDSDD